MKIVHVLSFCFVLTSSKAYEAVLIGAVSFSLIPPRLMFPLDIIQNDSNEVTEKARARKMIVQDDATKLRRSYLECMDETHVDPVLVKKFRAGSWIEHPSLKEWALCVMVKMDMMSRQGVYRYDTALSKIILDDKESVDKIVDECLSDKPKPAREIAWDYLKCHSLWDSRNEFPFLGIMYTF